MKGTRIIPSYKDRKPPLKGLKAEGLGRALGRGDGDAEHRGENERRTRRRRKGKTTLAGFAFALGKREVGFDHHLN